MAKQRLASRMAAVPESATLALNAKAQRLAAEGRTVYNLTAGELASDTPDYIQTAVAKTLDRNKYTPVAGLPELRQAIAAHSREFYGLDWIGPENVVVTGGAKPALYAALLALLEPGDEAIVPIPGWTTSYRPLIELCGGRIVTVPLDERFDLDVKAVQAVITRKTKAIILNSPNNPTGGVISRTAISELAKVLRGTGITVLADDIYSRLVYDKDFLPVPRAGLSNLVIINGFSKSQALTGWRIGYLIAAADVARAATNLLSHINGNAPLPSQYAGLAAMRRGDQPPRSTLAALQKRRRLVSGALDEMKLRYVLPAGAFYVLLQVPDGEDSIEWCERLLMATGVALVPGEAFDAPGHARLTFVSDESVLKSALAGLSAFIKG